MGLSSLVFGGLTLLQAKGLVSNGEEPPPTSFRDMLLRCFLIALSRLYQRIAFVCAFPLGLDAQILVSVGLLVVTTLMVAYFTKASDASFRSYLSDLSLQHHLRHIKDQQQSYRQDLSHPQLTAPAGTRSRPCEAEGSTIGIDCWTAEPVHVLTFPNRISISLRTPPYIRHDYGLFAFVLVTHAPTVCPKTIQEAGLRKDSAGPISTKESVCPRCEMAGASVRRQRTSWFVGVFGKWWHAAHEAPDFGLTLCGKSKYLSNVVQKLYGVLAIRSIDVYHRRCSVEETIERQKDTANVDDEGSVATAGIASGSKPFRRKKNALRLRGAPNGFMPLNLARNSAIAAQRAQKNSSPPVESKIDPLVGFSSADPASYGSVHTNRDHAHDGPCLSSPAALDPAVISGAVNDLQQQFVSLKSATDATQQQLHFQLEELRARKKDEDATRADIKGRMKTLDEGRRISEATKRESEKRLRSAEATREALQKRCSAARAALTSFKERERSCSIRLRDSHERGSSRRSEIEQEMQEKRELLNDAEIALGETYETVAGLEVRVTEEQAKVKGAEEALNSRIAIMAHDGSSAAYVQLAMRPPPGGTQGVFAYRDTLHPEDYAAAFGSHAEEQSHQAFDSYPSADSEAADWAPHSDIEAYVPGRSLYRRASQNQSSMAGQAVLPQCYRANHGILDQVFEPSLGAFASTGFANSIEHSLFLHRKALPRKHSVMRTPRQPRSLHNFCSHYRRDGRKGSFPPTSSFSTGLLPSNLLQNVDDDANSRVPSGAQSATIEAALNLFRIDTSGHSDAESNQSDRDAVDRLLNGNLQPLSEHESEGEQATAPDHFSQKANRSWWGTRSRQECKNDALTVTRQNEDTTSYLGTEDGPAEPGLTSGKRRPFGVFPRLSLNHLNPGARVFRSAAKKQADIENLRGLQPSGFGSDVYLGPPSRTVKWESSDAILPDSISSVNVGSISQQTPFDAVLRAFEASNPPDEEEVRRSWSAFDKWTQRQGFPARPNVGNTRGTAPAGSASPVGPSGLSQESFNGWSEDLSEPLGRSSSAGASIESSNASSLRGKISNAGDNAAGGPGSEVSSNGEASGALRERTNWSRFAFWSLNSKGSLNSSSSASDAEAKDQNLLRLTTSQGSCEAVSTPNATWRGVSDYTDSFLAPGSPGKNLVGSLGATSSISAGSSADGRMRPTSSKRRSFRWPRRQNSSARRSPTSVACASVASDRDADNE